MKKALVFAAGILCNVVAIQSAEGAINGFAISSPQSVVAGDALSISVAILSDYPIAVATAAVEGHVIALSPPSGASTTWTGALSLRDLAAGSKELAITATDTHGGAASTTKGFVLDRLPEIVNIEPPHVLTVRGSSVHIAASCLDAEGCASIQASVVTVGAQPSNEIGVASGVDSFSVDFPVADRAGEWVRIGIMAVDSRGGKTFAQRDLYIEPSGALSMVASVPGALLDFDDAKLLYARQDRALVIRDRTNATDVIVPQLAYEMGKDHALLTPKGAFLIKATDTASAFEFRDGIVLERGPTSSTGVVRLGPRRRHGHIIANDTIFDLSSGAKADVPGLLDIDADGSLVRLIAESCYKCGRFDLILGRNGVESTLETVGSDRFIVPVKQAVIEGDDVLVLMTNGVSGDWVVRYHAGIGETISPLYQSGFDDRIAMRSGWLAFSKQGLTTTSLFVERQSPAGELDGAGVVGQNAIVEVLGEAGATMIGTWDANRRPVHRYLSIPGAEPRRLGGGYGTASYVNSEWYVAVGNMLLVVETQSHAGLDAGAGEDAGIVADGSSVGPDAEEPDVDSSVDVADPTETDDSIVADADVTNANDEDVDDDLEDSVDAGADASSASRSRRLAGTSDGCSVRHSGRSDLTFAVVLWTGLAMLRRRRCRSDLS